MSAAPQCEAPKAGIRWPICWQGGHGYEQKPCYSPEPRLCYAGLVNERVYNTSSTREDMPSFSKM